MAVEPLSSVMTYQAQQISQPVNVQKETAETTEGQKLEDGTPVVDDKTLVVDKANNNNDSSDNEKQGGNDFNEEMMREAMKQLNKKATNVEAEFGIHEKTNRITIKMVDKQTKKVIKELPPEKMLDMIARIWEMSGLVVDEKR